MRKLILSAPFLFTNDPENALIKSGAVLLDDGMIEAVGRSDEIKRAHPDAAQEDFEEGVLSPGLVNLHHHLYSTFARGWNPAGDPARNFGQILERIWWRLDRALESEDIYYSALIGLCESVLSGVTCVVDHHSSQTAVLGSLDAIARAFAETGLRGSLCFELSDRAGGKIFEAGLEETVDGLKKWPSSANTNHEGSPGAVPLTAMVGLHASMTLSDESLKRIVEATQEFDAGYHFHLAEDSSDQEDCLSKYGIRVAERFARFGLLKKKSLAVHGVHLTESELGLLRSSGCGLVLCQRSNENNAVGSPKWWEYGGIRLGLGTDGIDSSVIHEARAALYLSRHVRKSPEFGFGETRDLLLSSNPEIFEAIAGTPLGKLSPGRPADIVYWRYNPPTPIETENVWGHFLYGLSGMRSDSAWIGGKRVLRDRRFVELDYDEILSRARTLAEALWNRAT